MDPSRQKEGAQDDKIKIPTQAKGGLEWGTAQSNYFISLSFSF
jgi:hypothetical protein